MAPMEFVKMRADAVLYFLPVSAQSIGYEVSAEMFASVICTTPFSSSEAETVRFGTPA